MPDPIQPAAPSEPAVFGQDHASLGMTEAEWNQRGPKAQDRINQLIRQRNEEREALLKERGQREALEKRLSQIEQRVETHAQPQEPKKQGWDQFGDEELHEYKSNMLAWLQRAAVSTGDKDADDEAREKVKGFDMHKLSTIDKVLMERAAKGQVGALQQALSAREQAQNANANFVSRMQQQYGAAVADPNSELRREAMDQFRALAAERNVTEDPHNLLAEMALQRAHARLMGDSAGRPMSALDRGRLSVEAQVRRDTAPASEIAALRERGDPQSRLQAKTLEIEQFWNTHFPG